MIAGEPEDWLGSADKSTSAGDAEGDVDGNKDGSDELDGAEKSSSNGEWAGRSPVLMAPPTSTSVGANVGLNGSSTTPTSSATIAPVLSPKINLAASFDTENAPSTGMVQV